jgi:hypothetical protein
VPNAPPKVFISYSHDSGAHEDRVLDFANRLRKDGIDAESDRYENSPAEDWPLGARAPNRYGHEIVKTDVRLAQSAVKERG